MRFLSRLKRSSYHGAFIWFDLLFKGCLTDRTLSQANDRGKVGNCELESRHCSLGALFS